MAKASNVNEGPAIGIDLGTTFSCVAVVRNGKVEVLANEQGNFTTPSVVAFDDLERLIGDAAKRQIAANPENTLFDVKRLIGRKFNDPLVRNDMQKWPFKIIDVNGVPKIEITYKGEIKRFTSEEISAMILGKMKNIAESYLNTAVKNAVITVPAYFNDLQRKAIRDAGTIAGLNVLSIINEPTAAAIAYGLENDTEVAKNVLVYDLGGGTFDVSILNIHNNVYEVKATGGDTHLGGEDFDNILMAMFTDEFKRKHNVDITGNKKALRKLRTACERAKRTLSSATRAPIDIDSLANGIDFVTRLTRAKFDELCADLFGLTIKVVKSTLKDAKMTCEDIDTVVLSGGSTRIPKIQQLLRELFDEIKINKTINPDEAVARGAAAKAAKIHGDASSDEIQNMQLLDVTPLTLGISTKDNSERVMSRIIERNTPIPVCFSRVYQTSRDNQTKMTLKILQGEERLEKDNLLIRQSQFYGIPAAPARVEKATVTFAINADGILNVTAVSNSNSNVKCEITIENFFTGLSKAEIDRMVAEAGEYDEFDREMQQYLTAQEKLQQYCEEIKSEYGAGNGSVNDMCNKIQNTATGRMQSTSL